MRERSAGHAGSMKRALALAMVACQLQASAWELCAAVSAAPAAGPSHGTRRELAEGLESVLAEALEDSRCADLPGIARRLEYIAIDRFSTRSRAAAAKALLQSLERPALNAQLRAFARRHGAPSAMEMLRRWESLIFGESARASMLAALSGLDGLLSSVDSAPEKDEPATFAFSGRSPSCASVVAPRASNAPISASSLYRSSYVPSLHKRLPNGLSPPGRAPPVEKRRPHPSLGHPAPEALEAELNPREAQTRSLPLFALAPTIWPRPIAARGGLS